MEKPQNNYSPENIAAGESTEYTPRMRWLLLVAAALGAVFTLLVYPAIVSSDTVRQAMPAYALFWAAYAVGFYAVVWERARKNAWGWYLLIAAFVLMARGMIFNAHELSLINIVFAVPSLLMLNSVAVLRPVNKGLEGQWFGEFFRGWFVRPFICMGKPFGALFSLFRKGGNPSRRGVLIGIAVALPVAGAVLALLISSDKVMQYFFADMFSDVSVSTVVWRILLGIGTAILFYSFIFAGAEDKRPVRTQRLERSIPAATMAVVIGVLLFVYAVFAYFQFTYLTGIKGLPDGLTYSQYAVSGFWQLVAVTAINLALFGVTLSLTREGKGLRGLLIGLLAATVVVLYSAIMRLGLYISAYGLTFNRILPMWLMLFLVLAVVLCCIRLFNECLHLIRVLMAVLVGWYIALNVVNIDAIVAKSIVEMSDERGGIAAKDLEYIKYDLSADAARVMEASPYYEEYIGD